MPQTTLTQRRNNSLGNQPPIIGNNSGKKIQQNKLGQSELKPTERGSVVRIVIWIAVVVFIGVGAALFVTSLVSEPATDVATDNSQVSEEPESLPVIDDADDTISVDTSDSESDADATDETDPDTGDLDVDNEEQDSNPDPDPDPDPDPETDTDTTTTDVGNLEEFSTEPRSRSAAASATITLNNRRYENFSGTPFYYEFYNVTANSGQIDPEIELSYEGNNLVIKLKNVATDNLAGTNNSGSRALGFGGIQSLEFSNNASSQESTYEFVLNQKYPSKVEVDRDAGTIRVEIDNT